jgi:hypothetical protein
LFDVDLTAGELRWKPRPEGPDAKRFNRLFAGKIAGRPDSGGHRQVTVGGSLYYVHRILWKVAYGADPEAQVDHINGVRSDNRLANLRSAKHEENSQNRQKHRNNTSGFKGVSWHSKAGKWQAVIYVGGRNRRLGLHNTPEEAHAAYMDAASVHHGDFARA